MFKLQKKGQSTLEYVILIGFVVSALIMMGIYIKRSIQGKLRESSDQIGEQFSVYKTNSIYNTYTDLQQTEKQTSGGASTVKYDKNEQKRTGYESVGNLLIKDASGQYIPNE